MMTTEEIKNEIRKISNDDIRCVLWMVSDLTPSECEELSNRQVRGKLRNLLAADNELLDDFRIDVNVIPQKAG